MQEAQASGISVLMEIVQEIHESGVLKDKFGKEIPILIQEQPYM